MTSPYPPQQPYPPQPGYAPQGYAPQPGYAPQAPGGYAPQPGYAPQGVAPQPQYAPPVGPPPVTARGTIEDFLDQAGGGGQSVTKFFTDERVNGHWLQLQVARDLMQSDVRPQLDNNKQQARDQQGRPKWVLVIQCTVLGSSDGAHAHIFPDNACSIWLKGLTKEGLVAAMSTAGVPKPDKALLNGHLGGAGIIMQSAGTRAARTSGFSAAKLYNFQYTPNGREMDADPMVEQAIPVTAAPPQYGEQPQQTYQAPASQLPPTAPPAPPNGAVTPPAPMQPQYQPQMSAPAAAVTPPAPPAAAPNGYAPQPGYEQLAQPAPTQQYQQAPPAPGYAAAPQIPMNAAPAAPPAPPQVPQGYAPPADAEKAATLARLQGLGG